MDTIGKRLEWVREVAGLSAREVDRLVGLTENHSRAIETKYEERTQAATLRKIAETLGVRASWLTYGQGKKPSKQEILTAVEAARLAKQGEVQS